MATASGRRTVRLTALAAAALAWISFARADSQPAPRAVIRGTGSDVTIVYESAKAAPTAVRASIAEDPVTLALQRKSAGEDDAAIVAFLRMHHASIPDVIDSDVLRDLRIAGAGEDVISLLLKYTAVDIGETAEGGPVQELRPPQVAYAGAYPDLVGMGYPFYGGFYGDGFSGGGFLGRKHFGRHGTHGRGSFRAGRHSFPTRPAPRAPSRATHARKR